MTEPAIKTPGKPPGDSQGPLFDGAFFDGLEDLIRWRRDVRRFRPDPVDGRLIDELIGLAALAPSVGNSQPWRFVTVADPARRERVIGNFEACNADALSGYADEQAKLYASLKLAGLREAPVHLAVFCDMETAAGHGLGQKTMPEMLKYSVVGAVNTLWLAARARGLGMGWVSILEPREISKILEVPAAWALIAYLCIGTPVEEHQDPELDRAGWQKRLEAGSFITRR